MDRKRLASGELRSAGYDARERVLEIEFTSGRIVQYRGVGEEIHRRLMSTASPGSYFRDNIEEDFPSKRLR
ncbi:MAG: KTSC domain-containing protein [Burkholderiales bacterium]